ncbi:long-chain fatty acid--CoA ligase [Metallumcola ferriviriculae]|uniref:Long-chain fatty acid--CoA ligase n=1 Tax=Metallumcola ferriviriculae TaxID=3039180 RepID=A0AAU0UN77_9FIRM|nr:long-chain fatty acid--CoA ligase [Desulfitibacteraceae bacterium MK1]
MSTNQEQLWYKSYPEQVDFNLEYPKKTLPQLIDELAEQYSDVDAYVFAGKKASYREFSEQVGRFATALTDIGITKGDRVAVMAPNCPQYVISYYAILKIGAVVVQTNPMYTQREVEHQLKDSGAESMIVYDALYPTVAAVRGKTNLKNVILFSLGQEVPAQGDNIERFEQLLAGTKNQPPEVDVDLEDVAVFQYTGGTTGVSKGAMLTHMNVMSDAYMVKTWTHDATMGAEKSLVVLPLFHSYGMSTSMNTTLLMAGTLILVPRFEPEEVLKLIEAYRPTIFNGVPTMYTALLQHPKLKDFDLSSIRICITGGSAMPVEVQQKFQNITGAKILEGFGLSESSPVTHCNPLGKTVKVGSIGVPMPDTYCKIVDIDTGEKELEPGQEGELIIKGPQVMKGYWNMDEETASTLRNGWLFTGDIAKMDDEGYFFIVDRKKEMIIAGGYNIYPREVEEVLYEHPNVAEAAVAGVPDEYRGETVCAFVVPKAGTELDEKEVIKFCRERMAAYKAPRKVVVMAELPKTTVGKILRRKLTELYSEAK